MEWTTLGGLAVLALIDSTSIGTLIIPIWLMLDPAARRGGRIPRYLAAITIFYFLVGVALLAGVQVVFDRLGPLLASQPAVWGQLLIGIGLFGLSFVIEPRGDAKRRDGASPWPGRISRALQTRGGVLGLAAVAGLLELPTMLPYLGAIALMTSAALPWPQLLLVLALYCLVMVLPAVALYLGRVLAAGWLDSRLRRLSDWLSQRLATATSWAVGILGFLLARDAVVRLEWVRDWLAGFGV